MEERKFIRLKKEEYGIKEYIKRNLGKGKISKLDIEYTPVGEKIIIHTGRPEIVIGRRGEKINELTRTLKTRFKFENPHIEIKEIENHLLDAQIVADDIAMLLERMGNLRFKVIAYRKLQDIMNAGALGCELKLSGKLPSSRARHWRFAQGYLKKTGESRKEVNRAEAVALTKTGIIGIKVAIMPPDARFYDRIDINEEMKSRIRGDFIESEEKEKKKKPKKKIKKTKKETKKKTKKEKVEKEIIDENLKEKVVEELPKVSQEEDGTAMMIEQEIEEGVPQEQIDKDLKKETIIGKEKSNKDESIEENKGDKK